MTLTNIPDNILSGRSVLRTDLTVADVAAPEKVKEDLDRVLKQHAYNRQQIRVLQEYYRGWHPYIQARAKTTRTDIDNKITVDYPKALTREIVGYFLGKPIQYTHRQGKFRVQMENLVGSLDAENKHKVDKEIADDASISGAGFKGLFTEANPTNGTHLRMVSLDPMETFVVYSSDPTKGAIYAVTSYESADTGVVSIGTKNDSAVTYYKVYTPTKLHVFKDTTVGANDPTGSGALELVSSTDINMGGGLPIVEYPNNKWRMGDWETAITLIDALDALTSDGLNDIQQAVNAVLVAMGVELDEDTFKALSTNGFLNVKDIPVGAKPIVEFINQAMDATVGKEMRDFVEATLRIIVGVPDRKTRGGVGGDTGDAVFMRDGWQDIDLVAANKEPYFVEAERTSLATILYILETYKEVKSVQAKDIQIHFNRNKTSNLQSKAQVFQILRGDTQNPGLAPEDALDIAGLTNNVHDVIMRMNTHAESMRKQRIEDAEVSNPQQPNSQQGGDASVGSNDSTV